MYEIIIPANINDAVIQKKIIIKENIKSLKKDVDIILRNYSAIERTAQQNLKIEMLNNFYIILNEISKKYEVKNEHYSKN